LLNFHILVVAQAEQKFSAIVACTVSEANRITTSEAVHHYSATLQRMINGDIEVANELTSRTAHATLLTLDVFMPRNCNRI
jgi:hypothetical protein